MIICIIFVKEQLFDASVTLLIFCREPTAIYGYCACLSCGLLRFDSLEGRTTEYVTLNHMCELVPIGSVILSNSSSHHPLHLTWPINSQQGWVSCKWVTGWAQVVKRI